MPDFSPMSNVKTLAQAHHTLAQYIAQGLSPALAASITGSHTSEGAERLARSPVFRSLVEHYTAQRPTEGFPSSRVLPPEVVIREAAIRPFAKGSFTAAQSLGLRFEGLVGRGLQGWAEANAWDYRQQLALRGPDGGLHIPDHVLVPAAPAAPGILIETKLTFTPDALLQLQRYAPLLGRFFNRPFVLCVACKVLAPGANSFPFVTSLEELQQATSEGPYLWHIWEPQRWIATMPKSTKPPPPRPSKPLPRGLPAFDGEIVFVPKPPKVYTPFDPREGRRRPGAKRYNVKWLKTIRKALQSQAQQ